MTTKSIDTAVSRIKKEFDLKGEAANQLLKGIKEALYQIDVANERMKVDSEYVSTDFKTGKNVTTPYGFSINRFQELAVHPARGIVKDSQNTIRANFKALGLVFKKGEKGEAESQTPLGILLAMRQ
jgi:hypothetical protein